MERLDDGAISSALAGLDWHREGDSIVAERRFPDFAAAVAFVNVVAGLAEAADHHPDILLRYRSVTLTLTTHDAGGLTGRDVDLARAVDAVSPGA
jgi:4a-hydroxytetrahydrobiopterin dehydratase